MVYDLKPSSLSFYLLMMTGCGDKSFIFEGNFLKENKVKRYGYVNNYYCTPFLVA
jgi:hypothetical protein